MSSGDLLTAEMNRDAYGDSAYTNTGGNVRRLSPLEEGNIQMRRDNKDLESYLTYPAQRRRLDNRNLDAPKHHLTDYLDEAPIVREHNDMLTGGSLLLRL